MSQRRSSKTSSPQNTSWNQRGPRIPYEVELPEFWDPTSSSGPFRNYYRSLFLNAVVRSAPEVLKTLRTFVWEKLESGTNGAELLARWAEHYLKQRFHLTDDWIVDRAERALEFWSTSPLWFRDPGWPSLYSVSGGELPQNLTAYAFPPLTLRWSVCLEPWSEFEERATGTFRRSLTDYRRLMTGLALSHGYRKSPRKRGRDGRHGLVAFDWLARWQVCGWTAEKIAAEFDSDINRNAPTAEAIMDQIRWAAHAIELTLRAPTRPGRPPRNTR